MAASPQATRDAYTERFIQAINRDCDCRADKTCMRVTANKAFADLCAKLLRTYVDVDVTQALYKDRTARMELRRAEIVKAVDGLEAAANLYRPHEPDTAAFLHVRRLLCKSS
jgi:hypothetical protein